MTGAEWIKRALSSVDRKGLPPSVQKELDLCLESAQMYIDKPTMRGLDEGFTLTLD